MILSCRDVTVAYDSKIAVDHVSFEVNEGEYVCIVGENGSGKSTLLKSILGLVPLKCGSVSFGPEVHRKRLGYLPQQTNIQKDFPASVYEVVLSGCLNRRGLKPFYSKADKEQAVQHMERLGTATLKNVLSVHFQVVNSNEFYWHALCVRLINCCFWMNLLQGWTLW